MAKRKTTTNAETQSVEATPNIEPVTAAEQPQEAAGAAAGSRPAYAPDPRSQTSVKISEHPGGARMHLLRSHKFNQMQIRFDGERPGEQYEAMLKDAGWRDRTESEGVWTKQIDREARWQTVQQMEREFRDVANAIRRDKGLEPVLEGPAMA
jgi:hypothetical protein